MPAISPVALVNAVIAGFEQSRAAAYLVTEATKVHPRKFVVDYFGEPFSVWIYIWTLTHGGRESLPDEFRIQITSVNSPLEINPSGYTILMGYHPELQVFGGFDLVKHATFSTGSPSVQIDISTLHQAAHNGLSFQTKNNDEIAIGIRPDQLVHYIRSSIALHHYGAEAEMLPLLNQVASPDSQVEIAMEHLNVERQKIVSEVRRYSRDANFRKNVLSAYDNRCAITKAQMKLVDAAHILPVHAEGSSDHVSNGIALSPTLHRAYDTFLIFLDTDFVMHINEQRANELEACGFAGGLDVLRETLNAPIHLPTDDAKRPLQEFIERANEFRGIPGYT